MRLRRGHALSHPANTADDFLTMSRVEDISSAVDYLTTLSYVDSNRIGALGICAGSGYTIKASTLDRRIKTVAAV